MYNTIEQFIYNFVIDAPEDWQKEIIADVGEVPLLTEDYNKGRYCYLSPFRNNLGVFFKWVTQSTAEYVTRYNKTITFQQFIENYSTPLSY